MGEEEGRVINNLVLNTIMLSVHDSICNAVSGTVCNAVSGRSSM